jgi:hypothetical protein
MATIRDRVEHARTEARSLHKQIQASVVNDRASIRAELQDAGVEAHGLATMVKTLARAQANDAKAYLKDAAHILEEAAKQAKEVGRIADTDLKEAAGAMLQRARDAVQSLSYAVASQRSSVGKNDEGQ